MTSMSKTTQTSGKPRIVFFGSGSVSAKSLQLLQAHCTIEAVVTKPTTAAEMRAVADDARLYTVANRKELDTLLATKPFASAVAVLVDFGIIVSQKVIDYFPLGIINSHFSLLPELRGADPISFAILEGLDKTGVSLMLLVEAMDEGPLLAQAPYKVSPEETTITLTQTLIELSDQSLKTILPLYIKGEVHPGKQEDVTLAQSKTPSYSRKLTKTDGILDFKKPAEQLEREIRAFIEWPKSRTTLVGKDVVITKAYAIPSTGIHDKPGDIIVVPETKSLGIATISGTLWVEKLKPAGKKEMTASAFLAGYGHLIKK